MRHNVTFTCSRTGTSRLWDRVSMAGEQELQVLFWKIHVTPYWFTKFPTWRFDISSKWARYAETRMGAFTRKLRQRGVWNSRTPRGRINFYFSWAEVAIKGVLCNTLLHDFASRYIRSYNLCFSIILHPCLWVLHVVGLPKHDVL